MGVNDAAEMLEAAKAECVRLEAELADMSALAEVNAMNYSDYLGAIEDAKEARAQLAAVQQPNREELGKDIAGWIRDGVFGGRDAGESLYSVSERIAAQILAALPIPATGEALDGIVLETQEVRTGQWFPIIQYMPGTDVQREYAAEQAELLEKVVGLYVRVTGQPVEVTP